MRRNAWLIVITADDISIQSGNGVEFGDAFFAEGAWAGPFTGLGLRSSPFRCGSGALIEHDEVILCAPTHSVEAIYCFSQGSRVIASNSLQLIVAREQTAFPPNLAKVRSRARTLKAGRADYDRALYETESGTMRRFAFGTVRVSRANLNLREEHPTAFADFKHYREYRDHLLTTLRQLVDNAQNRHRRKPYDRVVTTVSSGYDSAACAALGKQLGAQEAVTLTTGRGDIADSGKDVSNALGLLCHEYERFGSGLTVRDGQSEYAHYLDASHLGAEHSDFLATINTTEDLFFSSFSPHLANAVVLTGFHGDKAWDMRCSSGPNVARGDNSGSGLDEFRKRIGFVNVPVPYIGVERHAELASICESDDMAEYRVGGPYDRPLPRRIAEESGVPRKAFGFKKSMGSVLLKNSGTARDAAFRDLVAEYQKEISNGQAKEL